MHADSWSLIRARIYKGAHSAQESIPSLATTQMTTRRVDLKTCIGKTCYAYVRVFIRYTYKPSGFGRSGLKRSGDERGVCLKVLLHENFVSESFTLSSLSGWMGDFRTGRKINFCNFDAHYKRMHLMLLKGQCHEIFCFWFFS